MKTIAQRLDRPVAESESQSSVSAEEAEVQEAASLLPGCRSGWLTTAVVDATAALPDGIRIGWGVPILLF